MNDLEFTIGCPGCKRNLKIKLKEMVPGHSKKCPYCGTNIIFEGDDGRRAQHELDKLNNTIRNLKIKL